MIVSIVFKLSVQQGHYGKIGTDHYNDKIDEELLWAPVSERSRMASITVAGMLVGTVISLPISTFLATSKYFNCGGFIIQILCMLMAGFLVHRVCSVLFIIIGVGVGGFTLTSYS